MNPPDRLLGATFSSYTPQAPGQRRAKQMVEAYAEELTRPSNLLSRITRFFRQKQDTTQGMYLVGPVGTGKSHLLAAVHNKVEPQMRCSFVHMNTIARLNMRPTEFAEALVATSDVVCLDELEIDDAANEARLVTILSALASEGVPLLASSNVTPSHFMANRLGTGRFSGFLEKHFADRYEIIWMEGEDFRAKQTAPGYAWIGQPEVAFERMQAHYSYRAEDKEWLDFDTFLKRSETEPHERFVGDLASYDALYLESIDIQSTDDALRLLRIIDDIYTDKNPPVLYFTSATHPDVWLSDAVNGAERSVAHKFQRTISRIKALCTIDVLGRNHASSSKAK